MQLLAQTSPPDAQCRFLLEVKQIPHLVVSSEVLTTYKAWGKVLFDHFQFPISNFFPPPPLKMFNEQMLH